MKRLWPLVALGIGAFLLFALFTLPANVVLSRLGSAGVGAGGVSGTIWNGRAQLLQVSGMNIGNVEWKLHALPLFTGRARADVKVTRSDGWAQGQVSVGVGGKISFNSLTASLPLSSIPSGGLPPGWAGTINARFTKLTLEKGWPVEVDGTLDAVDLMGPPRRPANVGSYHVEFDPANSNADVLKGALSDMGNGPLQINGTIQLKSDRSFAIDALVAAKPDAPRNLVQSLEFLQVDEQGRRQFSMEGTL